MKKILRWLPIIILIIYIIIFVICKIGYYKEFDRRYNSNEEPDITVGPNGEMIINRDKDGKIQMKRHPVDPEPPGDITGGSISYVVTGLVFIVSIVLTIINNKRNGGIKNNKLSNCIFIILLISICIVYAINLKNGLYFKDMMI